MIMGERSLVKTRDVVVALCTELKVAPGTIFGRAYNWAHDGAYNHDIVGKAIAAYNRGLSAGEIVIPHWVVEYCSADPKERDALRGKASVRTSSGRRHPRKLGYVHAGPRIAFV